MQRLLSGIGVVLLVLAAIVAVTGGFETSVGGVPISVTSAGRLLFEGAVVLLLGAFVPPKPRSGALVACIAVFLIGAAADSEPRRVGDGFEYLGMATNLARLSPSSLSVDEASALTRDMAARGDSTWDGVVMPTLRGADRRYDFPHFWLCSLAAAPFVAIAAAVGAHPAHGFTAMNLALVLAVCWLLARAGAALVAVLFAALMLWWIDKAHAEIFIAALTAGALLLRTVSPGAALLILGVAVAQMPALVVLLVACAAEALIHHGRRLVTAAIAAAAIAALHPLYYLWRLAVLSPLSDTVIPHIPSARAFVTPLTDLNLGVVWFAPLLCGLTVAGAAAALRQRRRDSLPLALGAAALLIAAAEATNVNHGGTPGMSRYGVWLLALLLPLAAQVHVPPRWHRALAAGTALTVLFAALALHPRLADAGITPAPTPLAAFVWTRAPALDNPLPEVFVERIVHVDGAAPMPVVMSGGQKALIACDAPGALCYRNGDRIVPAPWQPGFTR